MKYKKFAKSLYILPLFAIGILMTGCYENAWENHLSADQLAKNNLFIDISNQPELSTFSAVLKKTGYDNVLKSANSFTVFAPTNSAWSRVDTTNIDQLTKMVGSLIVYNTYFSNNQKLFGTLKTLNGKNIFYDPGTQTFNGAKITKTDIRSANGVIQITDKIAERRNNIWEYLSTKTDNLQFSFINSLNQRVIDPDKSVAIGVDAGGMTKFDTVWMNTNNFLKKYPIDNEDSIYTYIIVQNNGFNMLYNKYQPYFNMSTANQTDSITRFNICQDFVFKGVVDITKFDTLTNVDGVKVPIKGSVISETYNASNGRVYVIDQSNIRLKDKIKPIIIEGEKFTGATDVNYVFTRYKLWASGQRDVVLSCAETQSDSLYRKTTGVRDSVASKTYFINSGLVANTANFYIQYSAHVNSAKYDVYYVAYDDIADHFDSTYTNFGVYKIVQKLFVSMPGSPRLKYGTFDNTRGVANNYLGDLKCFVGQGMAGVKELTKLTQWNLLATTQIVDSPVNATNSDLMVVPQTGNMTLWLCNTARSNASNRQGLLFLDYIMLVPRIVDEQ
jgi:uncharacterized surface protein with fasciclin (FAS1) repeats